MKIAYLLISALLLMLPVSSNAACIDDFVGEQMDYKMGWEFVMAGTAHLTVTRDSYGQHHQRINARTNKVFDIFKKVRDTIEGDGYCDENNNWRSTRFYVKQHERHYRAEKLTVFNEAGDKVNYSQNKKTDSYEITTEHMHVLDAFYKIRSMELEPGKSYSIPVFDSRKIYQLVVNVLPKTKKIRSPWGELVDCLVIEPKLKTAGVFSSKGKIKIWMSNDARHIPLKMSAKIKIGRIMAYLTDYKGKER